MSHKITDIFHYLPVNLSEDCHQKAIYGFCITKNEKNIKGLK